VRIEVQRAARASEQEVLALLQTKRSGITVDRAKNLETMHHKNIITAGTKNSVLKSIQQAFINPFTVLLTIIALIDYLTDIWSSDDDFLTIYIIITMILISGVISFVQSDRSNKATAKLRSMISNKVDVYRDGAISILDIDQIYPGDVIKFSSGDMLPADVRFINTKDTFVAQGLLTGESSPVEKFSAPLESAADEELSALSNIGFTGSNIVSGTALGVVIATGDDTYLGQMASQIEGTKVVTSFDRGVSAVSKLLIQLMLIMVPLVLIINIITKDSMQEALLFAISVAVGLTPEMLPVIMTTTLSRGALELMKKKVIVKQLSSIQGFGEMNILCTDKTGTLTEDRVVLERYVNVSGDDDDRILRHAYLNSHFQTGLKNLLDQAIITRAKSHNLRGITARYTLVDEVPFDFVRRRMSVVLEDASAKRQLITKGAVDEVLAICSHIELGNQVFEMDDNLRKRALRTCKSLSEQGYRIIAVAQKNDVRGEKIFGVDDEKNMVLIGFAQFLDPPKASAKEAVESLRLAGVRTVVLTGDAADVTQIVCSKVGVRSDAVILGTDIEKMDDEQLQRVLNTTDIFAKLSPEQKDRIVRAFQRDSNVVGYMGDGINDALAMRSADVGISVDTAVDIAKETANIILLEKDLNVLHDGVLIGRKTFGNIMKYIKFSVSGNFGNMISVIVASIFLPFLPMLPIQILAQNLLCDISSLAIPFDKVDKEFLNTPRKWEVTTIKRFAFMMGPLSSLFDILCFASLWWIYQANSLETAVVFQTGWFIFGSISQILIMHILRTKNIAFIQSRSSLFVGIITIIVVLVVLLIGFSPIAVAIDMVQMHLSFFGILVPLLVGYTLLAEGLKKIYQKIYGRWL
jgi:Mg2+-importing ATPase